MSILDLSYTTLNILSAASTTDVYGSPSMSYSLAIANVPGRINYMSGVETVNNGKELVIPTHKIFIGLVLDIDEKYQVIDLSTNNRYDVIHVNVLGEYAGSHHLELICKKVDQLNLT